MELNKDCIRDVLLECENKLILKDNGKINILSVKDFSILKFKYGEGTLKCTVKKLYESQLLDVRILRCDELDVCDFSIYDISFNGHEFLGNIRIKEVSEIIGSTSIQSLVTIATALITEITRKRLEDNFTWKK